jgi:hypothetical protein
MARNAKDVFMERSPLIVLWITLLSEAGFPDGPTEGTIAETAQRPSGAGLKLPADCFSSA